MFTQFESIKDIVATKIFLFKFQFDKNTKFNQTSLNLKINSILILFKNDEIVCYDCMFGSFGYSFC